MSFPLLVHGPELVTWPQSNFRTTEKCRRTSGIFGKEQLSLPLLASLSLSLVTCKMTGLSWIIPKCLFIAVKIQETMTNHIP